MRPEILVVYPYSSIDTNPTMTFLLDSLAKKGVRTDVLVPKDFPEEGDGFLTPVSFGKTVRLISLPNWLFFERPRSFRGKSHRVLKLMLAGRDRTKLMRFDPLLFGLWGAKRYSLILGVDPYGIVFAQLLNRWAKRPLVYVSFEIMFHDEVVDPYDQDLKRIELAACRDTVLALVQDEERAKALADATSISEGKMFLIPVSPPPQQVLKSDFISRKFGIPPDKRVVLYVGNLQSFVSRDDFAEMVSYWPDRYCLVVNSRAKTNRAMNQYISDLNATGKIYVSDLPVSRHEMIDLVASADFGLAPYKLIPGSWYTGKNIYHLGLSSGKVSFYAMCGLPILARSLPVFEREFLHYQCGKVYRRLSETGFLLEELDRNYAFHSLEARRFYHERLDPTEPMKHFCGTLLQFASMKYEEEV